MPVASPVDKKLAIQISDLVQDPVLFARQVLKHETWSKQEEIHRALVSHSLVAVKGCHASTKTFTAAEHIVYFLSKAFVEGKDAIAVTLGPTARQVRINVWKELRKNLVGSLINFREPNQMEWTLDEKIYAIGFGVTADTGGGATRLHGIQADRKLIIVDEAPGIALDIWDALDGLRAGGDVTIAALGNPIVPGGKFYEIFTMLSEKWKCITIDAFDSPNLKGITLEQLAAMPLHEGGPLDERAVSYPVVSRRWVREMYDWLGEDNPRFQGRVLGQFPKEAEGSLIPLVFVEAARYREIPEDSGQFYSGGIDIAGEGQNETCIYIVDKGRIVDFAAWGSRDPEKECAAFMEKYRRKLGPVYYDAGGPGHYFGLHLAKQKFNMIPFNFGGASTDDKFVNAKAKSFWVLREMFRDGDISNLTDELTCAQLAGILYEETLKGQIAIESKDAQAARGFKSPDRAESLMLACAATRSAIDINLGEVGIRRTSIATRIRSL